MSRYFRVPYEAYEMFESPTSRLIVCEIYRLINEGQGGTNKISLGELAETLKVSAKTVTRVLARLCNSGAIRRSGRSRNPILSDTLMNQAFTGMSSSVSQVVSQVVSGSAKVKEEPETGDLRKEGGGGVSGSVSGSVHLAVQCLHNSRTKNKEGRNIEQASAPDPAAAEFALDIQAEESETEASKQAHPRLLAAIDIWNEAVARSVPGSDRFSTLRPVSPGGDPFGAGPWGHVNKVLTKLDSTKDGRSLGGSEGLLSWFRHLRDGPWSEVGWWHSRERGLRIHNATRWGKLITSLIPEANRHAKQNAKRHAEANQPTAIELHYGRPEEDLTDEEIDAWIDLEQSRRPDKSYERRYADDERF